MRSKARVIRGPPDMLLAVAIAAHIDICLTTPMLISSILVVEEDSNRGVKACLLIAAPMPPDYHYAMLYVFRD